MMKRNLKENRTRASPRRRRRRLLPLEVLLLPWAVRTGSLNCWREWLEASLHPRSKRPIGKVSASTLRELETGIEIGLI